MHDWINNEWIGFQINEAIVRESRLFRWLEQRIWKTEIGDQEQQVPALFIDQPA
jgi:hypothetical protein